MLQGSFNIYHSQFRLNTMIFEISKKYKFIVTKKSTLVAYPMYTLVMCVMSGTIYKYYAYLLLFFALIQISFYAAYASNQKYSRLVTSNERLLHIPSITWYVLNKLFKITNSFVISWTILSNCASIDNFLSQLCYS